MMTYFQSANRQVLDKREINYTAMKNINIKSRSSIHLQKAAKLVKSKRSKSDPLFTEAEKLQIILEMEAYKIEMESQNKALMQSQELANQATQKYKELYDFAPSGNFTLSRQGE